MFQSKSYVKFIVIHMKEVFWWINVRMRFSKWITDTSASFSSSSFSHTTKSVSIIATGAFCSFRQYFASRPKNIAVDIDIVKNIFNTVPNNVKTCFFIILCTYGIGNHFYITVFFTPFQCGKNCCEYFKIFDLPIRCVKFVSERLCPIYMLFYCVHIATYMRLIPYPSTYIHPLPVTKLVANDDCAEVVYDDE